MSTGEKQNNLYGLLTMAAHRIVLRLIDNPDIVGRTRVLPHKIPRPPQGGGGKSRRSNIFETKFISVN